MNNVVLFSATHGGWSFARKLSTPSGELIPFLSTVSAVVNQRGDFYLEESFDLSALRASLDDVICSRTDFNKAVSSALRGRAVQSAVSDVLSAISSEYPLDKKQTAAMKDILKAYNVRYVLSAKSEDFEHVLDVGEAVEPTGEGFFFVANTGEWVVIKKQGISKKTTPVDILFYLASISSTLQSKAQELLDLEKPTGRLKPDDARTLALEASEGGENLGLYDLALKEYMGLAGAPIHYGVAYNRIRPPKRIKGAKTK